MRPNQNRKLPSGSEWLHEIKDDGFGVIARKKSATVRLYSRPGNDLTYRFPSLSSGDVARDDLLQLLRIEALRQ